MVRDAGVIGYSMYMSQLGIDRPPSSVFFLVCLPERRMDRAESECWIVKRVRVLSRWYQCCTFAIVYNEFALRRCMQYAHIHKWNKYYRNAN